jgi:hypothetical protein
VNHEDARRAISERMDGERLSGRAGSALERHLAVCAPCRTFEAGAWRLREAARFRVAEPVPDLVDHILRAVEAESARGRRLRLRRVGAGRPWLPRTLAPVAAGLVVGLVAGSLWFGGPWRAGNGTTLASAADVSAGVAAAASRLQAYRATFQMTERDPTGPVPVRDLSMNVWFRAPERFRLDVLDHTVLAGRPGGVATAPNDLQLIVNGGASYQVAPSACPVGVCPRREMTVRNRLPFSSATPAPTDLILPVSTLVDAREMQVVGRGRQMGRDAIEVRLPFERARPLFPFLDLGGSWRPFYPGDTVDLWLDARSWFPLRYTVYPAPGRERDEWELRFGLPEEPPDVPIFEVRALSIDETPPALSTFRIPHVRTARDEGAEPVSIDQAQKAVRFEPVAPAQVDGLGLYRVVLPESQGDEAVLTYSSGLSWLKLGETRAWSGRGFFGPVGVHAQQVEVEGLGTAYYEPATGRHGRRLAIHTAEGRDLYIETNLSREQMLGVAGSLGVRSAPVPAAWLTSSSPLGDTRRVGLDEAAAEMPFVVQVPTPPAGYTLASAEVVTVGDSSALNVYFQREDADFGAGPLRLHEELRRRLPAASAARQFEVRVRGVRGRWTQGRHELEWVEGGVYYSLDARSLQLPQLLAVAETLTPFVTPSEAPTSPTSSPAPGGGTPPPPTPLEP